MLKFRQKLLKICALCIYCSNSILFHGKTDSFEHCDILADPVAGCCEHIAGNRSIGAGAESLFTAVRHQIAPCRHNRKAVHALFRIVLTLRRDLLLPEKAVFLDAGAVMRRLRTKFAVLGTSSAAPVYDAAQIGSIAAEMPPQPVCTSGQCAQGCLQQKMQIIRSAQAAAV